MWFIAGSHCPAGRSARHLPRGLERFTVSWKRRTTLSLCSNAIPVGKPLTLFLELL
jgi:hypothetical protein